LYLIGQASLKECPTCFSLSGEMNGYDLSLPASRQAKAYRTLSSLNGHYVAGDGVYVDFPGPVAAKLDFPGKMKFQRICVSS
jgi:hypothetical protein